MITLCWAAKGGAGTTAFTAALALASAEPTLLVDLDGDLPAALGLPQPDTPGVHEWLESSAPPDRLGSLQIALSERCHLLPAGRLPAGDRPEIQPRSHGSQRWGALAGALRVDARSVIIDGGTRPPPAALLQVADRRWLVTRPCYLGLTAAIRQASHPTGIVLVDEPGRALGPADVETSLGVPVVAIVLLDPAVARAVDAGLLRSRLPSGMRRQLRDAA